MVRSFVILLAAFLVEGYQPKFKVFEIRKTRDQDHRVDDQYYDPDFVRVKSAIHKEKDNRKLVRLADHIVKRLQRLSERKDIIYSDNSGENSEFVDETRSLIVIPKDEIVYHTRPDDENILQKLIQSALRTGFNDVEDRTAPPRHKIPYEYDD